MGLYRKALAGWRHARGLFALNAGRLEQAELLLRSSIKQSENVRNPLLAETYLLLADTLQKRGRRGEAADLFQKGLTELHRSNSYSSDDENYLRSYFSLVLGLDNQKAAFGAFDTRSVRRGLRRDFPMSVGDGHARSN